MILIYMMKNLQKKVKNEKKDSIMFSLQEDEEYFKKYIANFNFSYYFPFDDKEIVEILIQDLKLANDY